MKRLIGRNGWAALTLALLAASAGFAPVAAQEEAGVGDRIIILVPELAPQNGADDDFGEDIAKELRKAISDLHTHQTVSDKEIKRALKQYGLDREDLYDCIRARQLAMQMDWGLVLCGSYQEVGNRQVEVTAQFVGAQNGETFDVPAFTASEREPRQAAQQVLQTFDQWQTQLRHVVFCQQYMDSQQWDSALDNCNKALAINPSSESALYKKAYIQYEQEQGDEALATLDQLLELDPIDQDALKLAGIVATQLDRGERARDYFDRYMQLNPGDVQVRLTIATEISNADDPEGALRFAESGLEVEPDNIKLIEYIGHFAANAAAKEEAALSAGEDADPVKINEFYQTAADSYQKVFAAQDTATDSKVLERLIVALVKLERFDEANTLGAQATTAQPENAGIWDAYSRALQEMGRTNEAMAALDRVESLGGGSPALTQRKAMMQLEQGNTAAGVAALNSGVQAGNIDPSDAFAIIFRHAYQDNFQKGRLDRAYSLLDEAGPLAVENEDKLTRNFWRGYILYQQAQQVGEPMNADAARKAKPMFERALELFQAARGYEKIHASADVPKLIDATQRFIEIQEALIKRGR
jgi:tetratricopeptide (TPR) repeat protein